MPHLSSWDPVFVVLPYFVLGFGIYKLILSIYGFTITGSENRGPLILFALLLSVAFVAHVVMIALCWQVKNIIREPYVAKDQYKELDEYGEDERITKHWDDIQEHFHCCGSTGHLIGYTSWKHTNYGKRTSGVPDSCCRRKHEGCGKGVFDERDTTVAKTIFVDGCLELLMPWMTEDADVLIGVYSGVEVVIAILEMISIALISAYVAQISRRRQRKEIMSNTLRRGDGAQDIAFMNSTDETTNEETKEESYTTTIM